MKNRSYMQTLDNDHFESVMYHVVNMDFTLADQIEDPTMAVLAWLYAEYDPKDRLWDAVREDDDFEKDYGGLPVPEDLAAPETAAPENP